MLNSVFGLLGVKEGPSRGVRTAPSCSGVQALGQWPTLHTHQFHTGTSQTLDVTPTTSCFQALKASFHSVITWGQFLHWGADGRMSPVSTSGQLRKLHSGKSMGDTDISWKQKLILWLLEETTAVSLKTQFQNNQPVYEYFSLHTNIKCFMSVLYQYL